MVQKLDFHRGETYSEYKERIDKKLPIDCNCASHRKARDKMVKPSSSYSVWSTRIEECVRSALQNGDVDRNRVWHTNAVKGEYAHLVGAGLNVNIPTTDGYKPFRIVASSLDSLGAVVFVAYDTDALPNQLNRLEKHMFVEDNEHSHYMAWY